MIKQRVRQTVRERVTVHHRWKICGRLLGGYEGNERGGGGGLKWELRPNANQLQFAEIGKQL